MTFVTHGFRVSVVSDVRERARDLGSPLRFMLRRSSLVECVSVLHGTCLQLRRIFFYSSVCAAMFVKKSKVHILYHKELADVRLHITFAFENLYLFQVFLFCFKVLVII
jgi:hypothetical protein